MHSELQFIDVVFKLTIFCLLAYKVMSLAKQYIIPFLYEQIRQERESRMNLIEKENLLISNQHKIETQIRHQNRLLNTLEQNMQTWYSFLVDQKNKKDTEYDQIKQAVAQKIKLQQKNYEVFCTCKAVLPQAISKAETELVSQYSGQNSKYLLDNLIEKISLKK